MTKTDPYSHGDTHRPNCIVRNRLTAYSALVYSMGSLWAAVGELHTPYPIIRLSFREHWVLGYGTIILLCFFWRVRCARERLWLGIALSYDAIFAARMLIPNLVAAATGIIRAISLFLWIFATLLSLFFVVSAHREVSRRAKGRGD